MTTDHQHNWRFDLVHADVLHCTCGARTGPTWPGPDHPPTDPKARP